MFFYKITLFLSQDKQGWSESWIQMYTVVQTDLGTVMATGQAIAGARLASLGNDCTIDYIKVTDVNPGVKRRVLVVRYAQSGTFSTVAANADGAMMMRFYSLGQAQYTLRPLRGVPQGQYSNNTNGLPLGPAYLAALQTFTNVLASAPASGWFYRGTPTQQSVTAMTDVPGNPAVVTVGGPLFAFPTYPTPARVAISKVLGATQVNGSFTVYALSATSFNIPRVLAFSPWISGSGVVKYWGTPLWAAVVTSKPERWDERKTGRPSYQSRGRRPARRVA